jgi:hypothetical protein
MTLTKFGKTAQQSRGGNVIQLRPHQRKVACQRRWAWWAAMLFGMEPDAGRAISGKLLHLRKQAGGARR